MNNIKCPSCNKKMIPHKKPHRPFCSERCKEIDLGHWFMEEYSMPALDITSEEQEVLIRELEKRDQGLNDD
jgi:uncharacterized protein